MATGRLYIQQRMRRNEKGRAETTAASFSLAEKIYSPFIFLFFILAFPHRQSTRQSVQMSNKLSHLKIMSRFFLTTRLGLRGRHGF